MMVDELEHLLADERIFHLLSHYFRGNEQDRLLWQKRVMNLEGTRPEEVVRLHGKLLACDWIEQNIGSTLTACYRVTSAGRKALKLAIAERAATV